ncbi:MAG TPA: tetratricopeptide repeat protein, partial [Vicinamibacterales bacterium]|nr:tetratricopeptide repeat protein [Vicinamibacterales bacterium]
HPRTPALAPTSAKPANVVLGLVVFGAVLAGGIYWMARSSAPLDEVARPARGQPPATEVSPPVEPPTASVEPRSSDPRPFLDAAGSGAVAYAERDYEAALASYGEAVARNPTDAEAHSNLGQILVRLNRSAEALPYFDRAIVLMPDRWAYHFNRARALGLLQQWDESIAGYGRAQQLFPDDYVIAFNLAQTLHRKGDEVAAVEQYRRAIALDPNDASFRLALGISFEKLQRPADAALAYSEYLRLAPQAPDADKVRARIAQLTSPPS